MGGVGIAIVGMFWEFMISSSVIFFSPSRPASQQLLYGDDVVQVQGYHEDRKKLVAVDLKCPGNLSSELRGKKTQDTNSRSAFVSLFQNAVNG